MSPPIYRKVVALDIGSAGLRAAQFTLRGRKPHLDRYAEVELPLGAVSAGVVHDPAAVGKALRRLWSVGKFSTKRVVLALANDRVLVRQLDLDWMEPGDFRKALAYAVADQIPMPVDEANLDFHVLEDIPATASADITGDGAHGGGRMLRVLLVAAARDMVATHLAALDEAGLVPLQADLASFALVRAVHADRAGIGVLPANQAEAIVDIGAETLTVVVHTDGQPRFVRTVGGMGARFLAGDAPTLVTGVMAPALPRPRPPASNGAVNLNKADRASVSPDRRDAVVAEIATTLKFFLAAGTGIDTLARLVFTGGGSRADGLVEHVTEALDTDAVLLTASPGERGRISGSAVHADLGALALLSGLVAGVS
ncbi:MAG: type IV pilus biogenesis protein PilM [Sporichthyaceae bacterium]